METITLKTTADLALCDPAPGSLADVPVGRELDALVAEHVMEWRWVAFRFGGVTRQCLSDSRLVREHWERVAHLDVTDRLSRPARAVDWDAELPAYSTDGDAMLAVLEKMRARGFSSIFAYLLCGVADVSFVHREKANRNEAPAGFCEANSLPEAVCRAAVRAALSKQVNKGGFGGA